MHCEGPDIPDLHAHPSRTGRLIPDCSATSSHSLDASRSGAALLALSVSLWRVRVYDCCVHVRAKKKYIYIQYIYVYIYNQGSRASATSPKIYL